MNSTATIKAARQGNTVIWSRRNEPEPWVHPWRVEMNWTRRAGRGEWQATIEPGFVNGRPAYIDMPAEFFQEAVRTGARPQDFGINPLTGRPYFEAWVFQHASAAPAAARVVGDGIPVRLTADPAPWVSVTRWRNPIASAGVRATPEGSVVTLPGEGYPPYFAELGVVPADRGGADVLSATTARARRDPARTRQLRAAEIILSVPRPGTRLEYEVQSPLTSPAAVQLSTAFVTDYFNRQQGRARVRAALRFIPPGESTIAGTFSTLLNGGDPQFDELHLATVWMVSPAGMSAEAQPDEAWEPVIQHRVWWNVNYAPRNIPRTEKEGPVVFLLPLAFGSAQGIINGILSSINGALNEAISYLRTSADGTGRFWST